ncbi:jg3207 [Pararge aegeria aegeria]|uniref:Jg3207 protein n=1 Tax=Pararge aegeria aegeria TaxID=348720 RepID=A0A8S4RPI3_9NEOP|nr:jg3207 [Pararge aegeria aegeria]
MVVLAQQRMLLPVFRYISLVAPYDTRGREGDWWQTYSDLMSPQGTLNYIIGISIGASWKSNSGSIAVVSRAQFELLEDAVAQLRRLISPQPLQLPDNKQLMSDVIKGTATLPDAMHTLQIDAKLRAAEDAVVRMAGLLTQLAAAGELPEELLEQLEALEPAYSGLQAQADRSRPLVAKKSVAIDPRAARSKASRVMEMEHHGEQGTPDMSLASRPSAMSRASRTSTISATERVPCVTHEDLKVALKDLRDDILKAINNMTARASTSAENALHSAKGVADKLGVALQLDERISTLFSVLGDYAEQLNGFDSGLTTQMQGFQDQMAHMRADLRAGLVQLENVNNNAETAGNVICALMSACIIHVFLGNS